MTQLPDQDARRRLLQQAVETAGGKAALGRLLGYKDGAFVGQMLRAERPVTEKTLEVIASKQPLKSLVRENVVTLRVAPKLQAQSVSHPSSTVESTEPPRLEWRVRMDDGDELPLRFRVQMPDDAMADGARHGWWVAFERCDTAPVGKRVMVQTADGRLYCRRHKKLDDDGGWEASADNDNYPGFQSARDPQMRIVARVLYVERPEE